MKNFDTFYFEDFDFDKSTLVASFRYSFDSSQLFEEKIDFSADSFVIRKDLEYEIINNLLFHIHIALWISYYKLFPTKNLIIKSWFIDDNQITFWKKLYLNWLWEFFVKNNIDPTNLLWFKNIKNTKNYHKKDFKIKNKMLLPVWWWKDSIVTYSLIKNLDFDTYVFWKIDSIKEYTSKKMWKKPLLIKRSISENLFKLNSEWYYNWHVPITWIIAFVSTMTCYLYNYKYIILSNEKSASEENTLWKWNKINHQYSKSREFEIDFSEYVENYVSSDIKYFSLLGGLYEYKIAEIFSRKTEFFNIFSSCNNNFKINSTWFTAKRCNNCDKCVFVFLILSSFLEIEKLIEIFWENLFDKKHLLSSFEELLWVSKHKPFECVWTYDECILSFYNANKKYWNKYFILKNLSSKVMKKIQNTDMKKLEDKLLKVYDNDIMPKELLNKINLR